MGERACCVQDGNGAADRELPLCRSWSEMNIWLPRVAGSVKLGRDWLADTLSEDHPALWDVLQCLSETLTNGIVHGIGELVELTCEVTCSMVRATVINEAEPDKEPQRHSAEEWAAEGGRGLLLVDAFSDGWGHDKLSGGRIECWFEVTF
jgi:anti-sigma regulatory factor (Ser/Thr protein kinase)